MSFPILGAWLYFFIGNRKTIKPIIKKINDGNKHIGNVFVQNEKIRYTT